MKEIFEKFIEIVEKQKDAQEKMKEELKKYVDSNKAKLEEAAAKIKEQFEEMMKKITDPSNIQEVMGKTMEMLETIMGKENAQKMMEIQKNFPFLNEYMKKIFPQAGGK